MVDNATKIAALEAILSSGARSVSFDGVSTTYGSVADIMKAIARLKASDTENDYRKRPRLATIRLGGF